MGGIPVLRCCVENSSNLENDLQGYTQARSKVRMQSLPISPGSNGHVELNSHCGYAGTLVHGLVAEKVLGQHFSIYSSV